MRHVILGAGPAGVIAAETIRKHAPYDSILIVGDEPEAPYSRMAIPYLLIGHVKEEGTHLRHGGSHFADLNIQIKQARCVALDAQQKSVTLSDGSILLYDTLLIATGSQPIKLPIPGIDLPGVNSCWTLEDARSIAALAHPGARVVQMGAGFIGCIIMDPLASRGVKLSVVEMGDRMVPRMMGPTAGGMIREWCEKKGVRVFTGAKVEAIEKVSAPAASAAAPAVHGHGHGEHAEPAERGLIGKILGAFGFGGHDAPVAAPTPPAPAPVAASGAPLRVRLSTGEVLDADLVISATGVRPNIGFLKDTGVTCLVGVLTDEHMQTRVPGIYAAGDCAEAFDKVSGKTIVSAIQPNAADQAYVAAMNMVGRGAELKGVTQINVLDTLGLISTSFGNWQGVPDGEHVELTDRVAGRHLSLQFKDDVLIGCNSIGWTEHVGVMRGLVEGGVKLGRRWKERLMADPTLLMEAYLARAQGQSRASHVPVK